MRKPQLCVLFLFLFFSIFFCTSFCSVNEFEELNSANIEDQSLNEVEQLKLFYYCRHLPNDKLCKDLQETISNGSPTSMNNNNNDNLDESDLNLVYSTTIPDEIDYPKPRNPQSLNWKQIIYKSKIERQLETYDVKLLYGKLFLLIVFLFLIACFAFFKKTQFLGFIYLLVNPKETLNNFLQGPNSHHSSKRRSRRRRSRRRRSRRRRRPKLSNSQIFILYFQQIPMLIKLLFVISILVYASLYIHESLQLGNKKKVVSFLYKEKCSPDFETPLSDNEINITDKQANQYSDSKICLKMEKILNSKFPSIFKPFGIVLFQFGEKFQYLMKLLPSWIQIHI
ncbi:adenosine receptor [Anaeramoeba flamelloides]|uniref:Adenosine receptor n=1 Tax=Anaeramoeba flamelloides TaxID=1746091 RepID=A0ABQ8YWB2_9EUKA|nr:adenosine receptor [Anaeramoeba flamelloides]